MFQCESWPHQKHSLTLRLSHESKLSTLAALLAVRCTNVTVPVKQWYLKKTLVTEDCILNGVLGYV